MPSGFDLLRLRSAFGTPKRQEDDVFANAIRRDARFGSSFADRLIEQEQKRQPMSDADQYLEETRRLMNEEGPGMKAYRDYLGQAPKREEYQPSGRRKFAAALMGMGAALQGNPGVGYEIGRRTLDQPYSDAMEQYALKGKNLKEIAETEQATGRDKMAMLAKAREYGLSYQQYLEKNKQWQAEHELNTQRTGGQLERWKNQTRHEGNIDTLTAARDQDTANYRTGVLGIGRTNAATQRANVDSQISDRTARQGLEARRVGAYEQQVGNQREIGMGNLGLNQAKAQQDVQDTVLRQMQTDPVFGQFVTAEDENNPIGIDYEALQSNPTAQAAFMDALNRRIEQMMSGGLGLGRGGSSRITVPVFGSGMQLAPSHKVGGY